MKLKDAILNLRKRKKGATAIARKIALEMGLDWKGSVSFVFEIVANDLDRVPGNVKGINEEIVIKQWLTKYKKGFEGRASKRISNPPGTVADPIIEKIIGTRLPGLKTDDLNNIICAHRLSMSAENVLGLLLEE